MSKKYFLTFATNFKNENSYLKEWLDYHLSVGVEHFYLYDQDGGEEAREILRPYEEKGQVTRHLWTHWDGTKYDGPTKFYQRNKNHMGFAHAAKNYRKDYQWVMKIDVDEFLFPLNEATNLTDWLKTVDAEKIKGVKVPRINFGNNGHEQTPDMPVLRAYTRREELYSDHKDLANGDFLSNNRFAFSAHWWHYKAHKFGKMLTDHAAIGWRINHYYIKSFEEYLHRQNVSRGRPEGEEGFKEKNQRCNEVEDVSMVRLLDQLAK
ncbi:glycosyltransferase family 92 protein [Marinoscillum sp.]|uniref:glycosyltransferase family 92 protein n=1 Tax=Marinoscillum sp. TaxID=2024838 RepID=UPI003BA8C62E